ncbi:hypothetical protein [Priestia megaterium]|uniref:hypothetical protein n=1 Tax=Priestia megaterium TaxID=1404 RepID=UPI002E20D759|nr:hypothetical protein [Priestia megaterium]
MSKAALSDFRNDYGIFVVLSFFDYRQLFFLVFTLGIVFAIRAFEMQEGEKKTQGNIWLLVGVVMILLDIVLFIVYAINRS